jgi:hypothetical protein
MDAAPTGGKTLTVDFSLSVPLNASSLVISENRKSILDPTASERDEARTDHLAVAQIGRDNKRSRDGDVPMLSHRAYNM